MVGACVIFFRPCGGKWQYVLSFGANERTKENIHPLQGHIFYNSPAPLLTYKRGYLPLFKPMTDGRPLS